MNTPGKTSKFSSNILVVVTSPVQPRGDGTTRSLLFHQPPNVHQDLVIFLKISVVSKNRIRQSLLAAGLSRRKTQRRDAMSRSCWCRCVSLERYNLGQCCNPNGIILHLLDELGIVSPQLASRACKRLVPHSVRQLIAQSMSSSRRFHLEVGDVARVGVVPDGRQCKHTRDGATRHSSCRQQTFQTFAEVALRFLRRRSLTI